VILNKSHLQTTETWQKYSFWSISVTCYENYIFYLHVQSATLSHSLIHSLSHSFTHSYSYYLTLDYRLDFRESVIHFHRREKGFSLEQSFQTVFGAQPSYYLI
jgi:hypothetical protein